MGIENPPELHLRGIFDVRHAICLRLLPMYIILLLLAVRQPIVPLEPHPSAVVVSEVSKFFPCVNTRLLLILFIYYAIIKSNRTIRMKICET